MLIASQDTPVIVPVQLTKADGSGPKTGLTPSTSGMIIYVYAIGTGTQYTYTQAAGDEIASPADEGVYEEPTDSTESLFAAIDATGQPGAYGIHLHGDAWSESGATGLLVRVVESDVETTSNCIYVNLSLGGATAFQANVVAALEAYGAFQALKNTTIETLATQTSFTLTDGSPDDSAYPVGSPVIITDSSNADQVAVGGISAYTGSTKTVTLSSDPGIFTMAVGDKVMITPNVSAAPSVVDIRTEMDGNSTRLSGIQDETDKLVDLFRLILRSDSALAIDLSTLITEINQDLGSGSGGFDNAADALERIADTLNAARAIPTGAFQGGDTRSLADKIDELHREQARKKDQTSDTQTVYESDGSTPGYTRSVSDDGTTTTFGPAT